MHVTYDADKLGEFPISRAMTLTLQDPDEFSTLARAMQKVPHISKDRCRPLWFSSVVRHPVAEKVIRLSDTIGTVEHGETRRVVPVA